MSTFKRVFMIAYLVCSLVVIVLFTLALVLPGGSAMMSFLHGCAPLAVLLILALLIDLVGLVAYTGVALVVSITRATARLRATEAGEIFIEKSALVSTASRALEQVGDVTLQGLDVDVVPRGDSALIYARVTVTPLGTGSLMALASRIQDITKRALEAFTEHEVRYVSVNFVEPRRHGEAMSAGSEAYEPVSVAASPVAAQAAAPETPATPRADVSEPAVPADSDTWQPATEPASTAAAEKKPSLWDRARAKASGLRSRLDAEDVVETRAEVVPDAPADPVDVEPHGTDEPDKATWVFSGDTARDDDRVNCGADEPSTDETPSSGKGATL
ncbi:MAG: hypothetical protein KHZ24_09640 [Coriobacteriia bacterium]|nr:hypothetical protein [Coriobacteriia bacterium]